MKKTVILGILVIMSLGLFGCSNGSTMDTQNTMEVARNLQANQPTPTDIDYSLERYNLIRRTYWVNGQRERANALICEIEKPLGYIILITDNGSILGRFVVDGKVSSLNSFLTPDTDYPNSTSSHWLADVDGSYGSNDDGIFFFMPDGQYIEWNGKYLYSDIPFVVDEPILKVGE